MPRLAGAAPRSSCSSDAMQSLLASAPRPLAPPSWCRLPAPDEASRPSPRLRPLHPRLGGVGVGAGSTTCRAAVEAENAVAIPDAAVEVETVRRHFPARQPDGAGYRGTSKASPPRRALRPGQPSTSRSRKTLPRQPLSAFDGVTARRHGRPKQRRPRAARSPRARRQARHMPILYQNPESGPSVADQTDTRDLKGGR